MIKAAVFIITLLSVVQAHALFENCEPGHSNFKIIDKLCAGLTSTVIQNSFAPQIFECNRDKKLSHARNSIYDLQIAYYGDDPSKPFADAKVNVIIIKAVGKASLECKAEVDKSGVIVNAPASGCHSLWVRGEKYQDFLYQYLPINNSFSCCKNNACKEQMAKYLKETKNQALFKPSIPVLLPEAATVQPSRQNLPTQPAEGATAR